MLHYNTTVYINIYHIIILYIIINSIHNTHNILILEVFGPFGFITNYIRRILLK